MARLSALITPANVLTQAGGNLTGAINDAIPNPVTVNAGVAAIFAANTNTVFINGSGPLTSFDSSSQGVTRRLLFNNAMTVSNGASTIQTGSGADLNMDVGDILNVMCLGLSTWKVTSVFHVNASKTRDDIGAAGSGANNDITSLVGLTTAIAPSQGGTGLTAVGPAGSALVSNGTTLAFGTAIDGAVQLSPSVIPASIAVSAGYNAFSVGPLLLPAGMSVTIAPGQQWAIR